MKVVLKSIDASNSYTIESVSSNTDVNKFKIILEKQLKISK